MQREVIARQKRRLAADASADRWKILRTVMKSLRMQDDRKWTQEYYSQEAREKIEA